jgi:hypothetical protein
VPGVAQQAAGGMGSHAGREGPTVQSTVTVVISVIALIGAGLAAWWARRALTAAASPRSRVLRQLWQAVGRGELDRFPALLHQLDLHLAQIEERLAASESCLPLAVQKIGLFRFDADPDLGGKVSFALALLDQGDNGVIITSLYRLEESRVFIREVVGGKTAHGLSAEEQRALEMALDEELQARRRRAGPLPHQPPGE